jgi:hypothetical protein
MIWTIKITCFGLLGAKLKASLILKLELLEKEIGRKMM